MRRAARVLYSFHPRAALPDLLPSPGLTYLAPTASLDNSAAVQQRFSSIKGSFLPWLLGSSRVTEEERPQQSCHLHSSHTYSSNGQPQLADEETDQTESMAMEMMPEDEFLRSITVEEGPLAYYKKNRLAGIYRRDPKQELTIVALQRLYDELAAALRPRRPSGLTVVEHVGRTKKRASWWKGLERILEGGSSRDEFSNPAPPRGLYMHGGVGTGKTMLMDLLVETAPPEFKLRRATFHDFMLDVHSRLHRHERTADPLSYVAAQLMADMRVLCLDEFFVTDVADATMLNRLFGQMWDRGLVLVATSNRAPDGLYENGLQRDLFLPFIARLNEQTVVHDISSATDYRRLAQHTNGLFFTPQEFSDPDAEAAAHFEALAAACHKPTGPASVEVMMGRHLPVPAACGGICMFPFEDLCGKPVAAADYIALAHAYHTLVLRSVPVFTAANRNEAYRFLTLVDVLYEHHIRLVCSAGGQPLDLFEHILTREQLRERGPAQVNKDEDVIDDNLGFSKERCISRLTEMQSFEYLMAHAKKHSPELLLALQEAAARDSQSQQASS
ncbi:g8265 [Coccomyxa elongata]